MKIGALVLADQDIQAKRIFKKLSENDKKTFLDFPISIFYKKN